MATITTDRQVKAAGPGKHSVSGATGLMLSVSKTGGRSWLVRVQHGGRRVDRGLGAYPRLSLAAARERAVELRAQIKSGEPPAAKPTPPMTLAEAVTAYVEAHGSGWSNAKYARQWPESLERHILPTLGDTLVKDITARAVQSALLPIWSSVIAGRVLQRLGRVLAYADTAEDRDRTNPASWKDRQKDLLPDLKRVLPTTDRRHRALAWQRAPELAAALAADYRAAARPLAFLLFTASRSSEVLGATWGEIDDGAMVWSVPPAGTKTRTEHRVPLVPEARAILGERRGDDDPVFPSPLSPRQFLSMVALNQWLRRRGWISTTSAHGLRACFRTWCAEQTTVAREIAEGCLAHKVGNAVERAYVRDDMLERRRALLAQWARFLSGADDADKVLPFERRHWG